VSDHLGANHLPAEAIRYEMFEPKIDVDRIQHNLAKWKGGSTIQSEGGILVGAVILSEEAQTHLEDTYYGPDGPFSLPISGTPSRLQPTPTQRYYGMEPKSQAVTRGIRDAFHGVLHEVAKASRLNTPTAANDIAYLGRITKPHEDMWRLDNTPDPGQQRESKSPVARELSKYGRVFGSGALRFTLQYGAQLETLRGPLSAKDYAERGPGAQVEDYGKFLTKETHTLHGAVVAHMSDYVLNRAAYAHGQHFSITNSIQIHKRR
jgi:hypothetical protein